MSETTVVDVATGGRSGIGAAPLTVSVLNFDPTLGCDSATFQPCSERALMSLKFLIDVYRTHYPINQDIPKNEPVLIGGYLEDTFLGGGVSGIPHPFSIRSAFYFTRPSISRHSTPRSSYSMLSSHGTFLANSSSQSEPYHFSSSSSTGSSESALTVKVR